MFKVSFIILIKMSHGFLRVNVKQKKKIPSCSYWWSHKTQEKKISLSVYKDTTGLIFLLNIIMWPSGEALEPEQ